MIAHAGKPEFKVEEVIVKKCCNRKMITCFKKVSQVAIEICRDHFISNKSEVQQSQFVIDYMRSHVRDDKSILYSVSGQEVCETCWRLTYGIRLNRFKALLLKFERGVVVAEHGLTGKSIQGEATLRLISWMRSFFGKIADHMPMGNDLHLPSCLTKADVYELAKDDLTQGGLTCCSPSHMYQVWKSEFPNVKIPKV